MEYTVVIRDTGESFVCRADRNIVEGHNRSRLRSIRNQCRSGGCGFCKVQIVSGSYEAMSMSSDHISAKDLGMNIVLACRVLPHSDLIIRLCAARRMFSWDVRS